MKVLSCPFPSLFLFAVEVLKEDDPCMDRSPSPVFWHGSPLTKQKVIPKFSECCSEPLLVRWNCLSLPASLGQNEEVKGLEVA